jgi:chemotaxis protein CheD
MTAPTTRKRPGPAEETPRRYFNAQEACWHVQITQGETHVSGDPTEVIATILGSCISACIRDPIARVGGMNHFLLPDGPGEGREALRYGVNAMELLINNLLKHGAARNSLEAKLFGGANVMAGLSDVGSKNASFAERFLADEGIPVVGGSVGGTAPRRIQFWPVSGRARQFSVRESETTRLAQTELNKAVQIRRQLQDQGNDIELF